MRSTPCTLCNYDPNTISIRLFQYNISLPTVEYSFPMFCFLAVVCISWEELQLPSAKGYSWTGNTDVVFACVNFLRTRLKKISSSSLSLSFSSSFSSSSSPLSKAFNRRARNRLSTCVKKYRLWSFLTLIWLTFSNRTLPCNRLCSKSYSTTPFYCWVARIRFTHFTL